MTPELPEEPVEIEITPELDLHTFQPREVSSLLDDYLAACWEKGIHQVRIIHGKGTGALRIGVHEKLSRMSLVAAITWPASADSGGWGATWVQLHKPDDGQPIGQEPPSQSNKKACRETAGF